VLLAQSQHNYGNSSSRAKRIGGAARRSHEERLAREQRLEQELRSKRTSEVEFD
jgi:hypothetical protein